MDLVYGADAEVIAWVERRYGFKFTPPCVAVGVGDGHEIIGAVVWNAYSGPDIEGSCFGETRAFTRSVIAECFRYPFQQLGCRRVTIHVRKSNARVIDLARRLGFVLEGEVRQFYGDENAWLLGLLRDDAARWMR